MVARRRHHHDPCLPCGFHCLVHRIEGIALKHRPSQRDVHHADVVRALQRDGFLNRSDHAAVRARSVLVQHAQVDEGDIRSHAGIRGSIAIACARARTRAADQAGHMGSMPKLVGSCGVAGHKALAVHHAADAVSIVEIGMSCDAAINDGHADTGTIEPILRRRNIVLDCGRILFGHRITSHFLVAVRRDVADVGITLQFRQHADRHAHHHRTNGMELVLDGCAPALHGLQMSARRHLMMLHNDGHHASAIRSLL